MLKTSHLQELKRRYGKMYAPEPEEIDEHCGVCGEGEGIEEGKPSRKLAQRDIGMECQECGKKFRAKLSTLQYGKTKCPKCKSTDLDFAYGEQVEEEVELDEMNWAVGGVYHQEFKNGDKVYFRADSVQKNKRWKGMSVDEFGGKQKKAKNASADEKQQGWKTTPKNEIPKGLKEEVEIEEGTALQVKMALSDVGLKGEWKNNKVYVKKSDVKKAEKALKGNGIYKGKPPVVVGEEVEEAHKVECPKCKGEGC